MDRELVAEVPAFGDLYRVHVADQVAHAGVGGGELLGVAILAGYPHDRGLVAVLGHERLAVRADRPVRVVVGLGSGDRRRGPVKEVDHRADQPGLRLPTLPEQDQVVAGQDATLQRRKHRVVEPHQAGEEVAPRFERGQQVLAELLLDGPVRIPRCPQRTECGGSLGHAPSVAAASGDRCSAARRRSAGGVQVELGAAQRLRELQGRAAVVVMVTWIGSPRHQHLHERAVATCAEGGAPERRVPVDVFRVDGGAVGQQELGDRDRATLRRVVQRVWPS